MFIFSFTNIFIVKLAWTTEASWKLYPITNFFFDNTILFASLLFYVDFAPWSRTGNEARRVTWSLYVHTHWNAVQLAKLLKRHVEAWILNQISWSWMIKRASSYNSYCGISRLSESAHHVFQRNLFLPESKKPVTPKSQLGTEDLMVIITKRSSWACFKVGNARAHPECQDWWQLTWINLCFIWWSFHLHAPFHCQRSTMLCLRI